VYRLHRLTTYRLDPEIRVLGYNEKGGLKIIRNLNDRWQKLGGGQAKPGRGRPVVILESCVMAPVIARPRITGIIRYLIRDAVNKKKITNGRGHCYDSPRKIGQ